MGRIEALPAADLQTQLIAQYLGGYVVRTDIGAAKPKYARTAPERR
jgi:hypothetical protein